MLDEVRLLGAAPLLAQAAAADPITGGAGWLGAGLLGMVLAVVFFVILPAKDRQVKEMIDAWAKEREADRLSRHAQGTQFQGAMAQVVESYREECREMKAEFRTSLAAILDHCRKDMDKMVHLVEAIRHEVRGGQQKGGPA